MKLINFTTDLSPISRTNGQTNFQPILAFSASKNAFLILCDLFTTAIPSSNKVKINNAYFKIHHLNNDINYCTIKKVRFDKKDNQGKPAFFICLGINQLPDLSNKQVTEGDTLPEIDLSSGEVIRFHLDFTDNCSNSGTVNSGDWPCNTVKTVGG